MPPAVDRRAHTNTVSVEKGERSYSSAILIAVVFTVELSAPKAMASTLQIPNFTLVVAM